MSERRVLKDSSVSFGKPDFAVLKSKGFVCVDMHVHSCNSLDSVSSVEGVIEKARKTGCGVAITDHNSITGSLEGFALAKKKGVFFVPGIEVTCKEGVHILLYFYDLKNLVSFFNDHVKGNLINEMRTGILHRDLISVAGKYEAVVSAAHPFGSGKCGLYRLEGHADVGVVEGLNGSLLRSRNVLACGLKGKSFTGGTDAHVLSYIGNVVNFAKARSLKEFLDAVKSGNAFVVGKELGFFMRLWVNFCKEISLIRKMRTKEYIKNRLLHLRIIS